MVQLNKQILSLPVGKEEKLISDTPVTWESNNVNVIVDQEGRLFAENDFLRPDGQAVITATDANGNTATCKVTIVSWRANEKKLQLIEYLDNYLPFKGNDGNLYALYQYGLYDFVTKAKIGDIPVTPANVQVLATPHGYFYFGADKKVYRSTDLQNWTVSFNSVITTLYHGFSYKYDVTTDTVYIFIGDYTVVSSLRPKLHRGVITATTETWATIKEFYSRDDAWNNQTLDFCAMHLHVTAIDPFTGDLWVNTGDANWESAWYRSTDNGDTLQYVGTDSQDYRSLSIWFTVKYIYWNMDTSGLQSIYRLARTNLSTQSPSNDQKEKVVELANGSHWYHCWAKHNGKDVVIMGQSAEGQHRDWRARVFMFEELADETVDIQEIFTIESTAPDTYMWAVQMEPKLQDDDGYLYLKGRTVNHEGLWKMQLTDTDTAPVKITDLKEVKLVINIGGVIKDCKLVLNTNGESVEQKVIINA